jgi:N6-L-threonylcarbamoyladenine synthase
MILGIESSCDESALALYSSSEGILGEWIHSQIIKHSEYGGVVPDIAVSEHLNNFIPLLSLAKEEHQLALIVSKIAVTCGPGLVGCLGIGMSVAKSLGLLWDIPVVGVNHLRGHAFSPFLPLGLYEGDDFSPYLPHLGLLVSGGNTILFTLNEKKEISIIAQTVDDAVGEALDKGAKLLGIPYPGGAELERQARGGNINAYDFPQAFASKNEMKFSFSGLKTSLLYTLKKMVEREVHERYSDLAASYQNAAIMQLVRKTGHAFEDCDYRSIGLSGGVANNQFLRDEMNKMAKKNDTKLLCAAPQHTGDNAAMICFAASVDSKSTWSNKNQELSFNSALTLDEFPRLF